MKPLPSYEELHRLFYYDDGKLFYKGSCPDSIGRNRKYTSGKRAGALHPLGYRKVSFGSSRYMEHRIIWIMHHKDSPAKYIDHINNKRDDNRIENLRVADRCENNSNAVIRKDNTTGIKGVYWNKRDNKYTVSLSVNGNRNTYGNYSDIELAGLVASELRDKYHGPYANHGHK